MKTYEERKEIARNKAIDWQSRQSEKNMSYGELQVCWQYFSKLAKRYGLIKEFRENGII